MMSEGEYPKIVMPQCQSAKVLMGQKALVTGGNSGIGKAVAIELGKAGAGLGTIARTIHPYPTQAEAIKKAGDAYNRTRLKTRVQSIFNTLLK
jgi:NAD(P)-dependent dehydrogenase (short-subunit alcohol dehydrogenase family)